MAEPPSVLTWGAELARARRLPTPSHTCGCHHLAQAPSRFLSFCLKIKRVALTPALLVICTKGQASRPWDKDSGGFALWPCPGQGVEKASLTPPSGGAAGIAF